MTRCIVIISRFAVGSPYPKIFYCNGCRNLNRDTSLSTIVDFKSRGADEFERLICDFGFKEISPEDFLFRCITSMDEFVHVSFDGNDSNPSFRALLDIF